MFFRCCALFRNLYDSHKQLERHRQSAVRFLRLVVGNVFDSLCKYGLSHV